MPADANNAATDAIDRAIAANNDKAVRCERAVLGCLIEAPAAWGEADLTTDDFLLDDHQRIWQALCKVHGDGIAADITTLVNELDGKLEAAKIASLTDGCVPENFKQYVRGVCEAARERRILRLLLERIPVAKRDVRLALLDELTELLREQNSQNWRSLFHDYVEVSSAPDPEWLIANFAEVEDIVMIGGPSGHGKSLCLLSICRALLTAEPLFNFSKFQVPTPSTRVLYLIPEVGLRSFRRRLEWFHLLPFVQSEKLFVRTLSCGPVVSLTELSNPQSEYARAQREAAGPPVLTANERVAELEKQLSAREDEFDAAADGAKQGEAENLAELAKEIAELRIQLAAARREAAEEEAEHEAAERRAHRLKFQNAVEQMSGDLENMRRFFRELSLAYGRYCAHSTQAFDARNWLSLGLRVANPELDAQLSATTLPNFKNELLDQGLDGLVGFFGEIVVPPLREKE